MTNRRLLLVLVPALAGFSFQDPQESQPPDPEEVNKAIERGAEWILGQLPLEAPGEAKEGRADRQQEHDLVLLTLLHAGIGPENEKVEALIRFVSGAPLRRTYQVSIQAMALQKLMRFPKVDIYKIQLRIAQCAQFLLDNQCRNGQWSYGEETRPWTPTGPIPKKKNGGTESLPRIRLRPNGSSSQPAGDNSNSQYALLGLRAAMDCSIEFPEEVLKRARAWWESAQGADGGWGYKATGIGPEKGSMTAAGVAAVAICDHYLGKDSKADLDLVRGVRWLGKNFSVEGNPFIGSRGEGPLAIHHYYYLYGLERAGILAGTEEFGNHPWYAEGARYLLAEQKPNGSWTSSEESRAESARIRTCFAILFLRRATDPLGDPVATESAGK